MRPKLPIEVRNLVKARDALRDLYVKNGVVRLAFALDGNLVGDLGEAVAAKLFDLTLADRPGFKAVDATAPDGRTVQIKTTGSGKSFAFTHSEEPENWLLALALDYQNEDLEIVYNGPYAQAINRLKAPWVGQKQVRISHLKALDQEVADADRLPLAV